MHEDEIIPLSTVQSGVPVVVARLDGGDGFRSKVISMGLVPGNTVTVRSSGKRGPLLVQINGSRVGIGREVAERIMVKHEP
ncbi:MAG TPA: FeoA family protein [Alkalispirochaeta sp.]|nr:FeoA family protein [Alkalispirochaeta sp.]